MMGMEKHLRKSLIKSASCADSSFCRVILDELSSEFRHFLTILTGVNFKAMTAAEMNRIEPLQTDFAIPQWHSFPGWRYQPEDTVLGNFFSRCDSFRFSGQLIKTEETLSLLGDLKSFLAELGKSMRKQKNQNGELI